MIWAMVRAMGAFGLAILSCIAAARLLSGSWPWEKDKEEKEKED